MLHTNACKLVEQHGAKWGISFNRSFHICLLNGHKPAARRAYVASAPAGHPGTPDHVFCSPINLSIYPVAHSGG